MRKSPLAALVLALCLAAPLAHATGVTPAAATPVQREQAQSRFLRGQQAFNKKNYEAALTEFSASLDIVASPNTRLYMARAHRELGHIVHAYVELGRTEVEAKELAREDPRYEKAGQAAHDERAQLEPKLAFVNVDVAHAEDKTVLKVGGEEVKRGGWNEPLPVMPGNTQIIAETPGRAPVTKSVDIQAKEKKSVSIDVAEGASTGEVASSEASSDSGPAPAAQGSGSMMRNAAYVAGGAAVVGLGLFAFFGLKANSTHSDLEDACPNGPCPPGRDGDISEGRTQQTIANVGLAVFLVGGAAAVTLYVLGAPKAAAPASGATAKITAGPSFVGLKGTF